jgi:hypothetical protein
MSCRSINVCLSDSIPRRIYVFHRVITAVGVTI